MVYKSKRTKKTKRTKRTRAKRSKSVKKHGGFDDEKYNTDDEYNKDESEHYKIPKEVLEEASEAASKVIHDYLLKHHHVVEGAFSPLLIPVAMKLAPKALEMAKKYGPKAMDMAKKYGPDMMKMMNTANK
jgi:hypothetical protein